MFDLHLSPLAFSLLTSLFVTTACFFVLQKLLRFTVKKLSTFSNSFSTIASNVLSKTHFIVILLFALLIGANLLDLSNEWSKRINHLWFIALCMQIALWFTASVKIWQAQRAVSVNQNPVLITLAGWLFRFGIWSTALLAILANIGINITAFIASLGVGGIAVALAVQNILSDILASLAIGIDKPFVEGDYIVFDDLAGTVECIGLKTTRIRSLSGELIICSNAKLIVTTIKNYKHLEKRRISFTFTVSFDTPKNIVADVPQKVREKIENIAQTEFERSHLKEFGEYGFVFETVYHVQANDYLTYMNIQEEFNLALLNYLEENNIRIAVPERYVTIKSQTN